MADGGGERFKAGRRASAPASPPWGAKWLLKLGTTATEVRIRSARRWRSGFLHSTDTWMWVRSQRCGGGGGVPHRFITSLQKEIRKAGSGGNPRRRSGFEEAGAEGFGPTPSDSRLFVLRRRYGPKVSTPTSPETKNKEYARVNSSFSRWSPLLSARGSVRVRTCGSVRARVGVCACARVWACARARV